MKVCIFDEAFIPGLGQGPFRTPVEITRDRYDIYKRMGLHIIDASATVPIAESGVINRVHYTKQKEETENIKETPVIESIEINNSEVIENIETVNNDKEEIVDETSEIKEEELEIDEEVEEDEEEEVDIDSLSKKDLLDLLKSNDIPCNNSMTKKELTDLVNEKL